MNVPDELQLIPCPFCAKSDSLRIISTINEVSGEWFAVQCDATIGGCGAQSGFTAPNKANACEVWNTRPNLNI